MGLWVCLACGQGEEPGSPVQQRVDAPAPAAPAGDGDPLLAEARASIADGKIAAHLVQALLESDAPAHRRARRILSAMQQMDDPGVLEDAGGTVPIVPPPIPTESGTPARVPGTMAPARTDAEASVSRPSPRSKRGAGRASLTRIGLRETRAGATLTLRATGGVVVGVANQHQSGIVRLIVEATGASAKVLDARPSVAGARVTSIRRGSNSIFLTLALDPGWSLGTIRRFSGGARIHLRRPG